MDEVSRRHRFAWLPAVACFAFALCFAFSQSVSDKISNDEHVFLAAPGMMARGNGLIYRDYFYNHVPTQVLILGGLFRLNDYWALASRGLNALCAAGTAMLLFEVARRAFVGTSERWRIALASTVAAIFLFNPITAYVVGRAWNHDIATLACLGGFVCLAGALDRPRATRGVVVSGALAAIAATTRLTFVPTLLAFVVMIAFVPGRTLGERARLLALWSLGALLGAAPALWVFLQAPAAAYFDNFKLPGLSARYQAAHTGNPRGTIVAKLDYIASIVRRSNALLVLSALATVAVVIAVFSARARTVASWRMICLILLVATAAAAAFAPTPMYTQYLYGPLPFAVLAIIWAAASIGIASRPWARVAFVLIAVICILDGRRNYTGLVTIFSPRKWTPLRLHEDGRQLAAVVGPGKILTYGPATALEANLPIYHVLSTGRGSVRIGDYLTPGQRVALHVPNLDTVRQLFTDDPPAAVLLVDPMSGYEQVLESLAREHGYVERPFVPGQKLFLPPSRSEPVKPSS